MKPKKRSNDSIKGKMSDIGSDYLTTHLHPWLKVGDMMNKDVITISSDETLTSTAKKMSENNISCIIVADDANLAGILTETDFLKRVVAAEEILFDKIGVAEIMSFPVESISSDLTVLEASKIMEEKHIKRLPILEEKRLVGIVTQTDLIRVLTSYGMWKDVAELMSRDVAAIQKGATVTEATKVMASRNISSIIVMDADEVVGVVTERDLLKRVVAPQKDPTHIKIEKIMSYPVMSISPDYSIFSTSRIMEKRNISRLVVMEDERLCGIVTQTDIFEGVKNKLQEEEEKKFRLLENSRNCVYTLDLDGKITYVNSAFMKLLEVSDRGALINQPFLPKRFWANPQERVVFLKKLKNSSFKSRELALKTSKGKKIYVTLFSTFTKDIHGEINGIQGILYDITSKKELVELRQAEESLRESEKRISRMNHLKEVLLAPAAIGEKLKHITDAIVEIFDADFARIWITKPGNLCDSGCVHAEVKEGAHVCQHRDRCLHLLASSGRYTHIDGKVHRRVPFGCYKIGRVAAGTDSKFITNDVTHDPRVHNHDWAKELGLVSFAGYRLVSTEGKPIGVLALFSKHVISSNDDTMLETLASTASQVVLTTEAEKALKQSEQNLKVTNQQLELEIVEHKKTEEELIQAKKEADTATAAKSEFLANMSHEIRTPMNAIIGFSDFLADENLTDEQKGHIDIIQESGHNLLKLIDDILDFSKIEAKQLKIEMLECSLGRILNFIESTMRLIVEKESLDFKIVECDGLPKRIRTDPARLRQCLINLVDNAIKFTEKGHVHLNISLEESEGKPFIRFDVEDTGIGIAHDKQEVIFESFTQADGATTRKYGGTGLGLAVTKQLAELLGGELTVTSEVGKGSVFSLTIPAGVDVTKGPFLDRTNIAEHTDGDKEKREQAKLSGHVLVAEDVETNQILTKILLNRMGLEVTTAADGNEAVKKALAEKFDLIFMDIQMPNMNGYEATRLLRKEGLTTPIVALTAYTLKGDDQKCIEAGCDDYLGKPIDRRQILAKLRKYLPLKGQDLIETVDSVKSQVGELTNLCCDQTALEVTDAENSEVIINLDQLINILGDEEAIKEIVPTYLDDNKKRFDKLVEAINSGDAEAIRSNAHAIKGAGRNFGVKRLVDTAYRLECAGIENDVEAAVSSFDELKREFEKVVAFLSRPDWIEIAKQQGDRNEQVAQS